MKEVLQALTQRPMTAAVLARNVGIDKETLGEIVTALIVQDLVEDDGSKLAITDLGRKSLAMADVAFALASAGSLMELGDDVPDSEEVIEVDVPETFELAIAELVPTDIEAALANLSQVLTPRQIQNLPTKLAVLERLSELLDPSIAVVLAEIQNDLKVAA